VQYEYILNPSILDGRALNGNGETFVEGFPARDEFIRAIGREVRKGTASPHGGFYVDLSASRYSREELTRRLEEWLHQFWNLRQVGIDLRDDKVEMAPAAHYCLGGIKIDDYGRTNLEGLFAAGEITGNVHGANRISGNALSETQVFGKRCAEIACQTADEVPSHLSSSRKALYRDAVLAEYRTISDWKECKADGVRPIALKAKLQEVMNCYVGLERNEQNLLKGLAAVRELLCNSMPKLMTFAVRRFCYEVQEAYEVRGMLKLAELVILSAVQRKESRGHHFRVDYPETDPVAQHTLIQTVDGKQRLEFIPVVRRQ
jgi:fumarate reductase (CoM/CoB) subunit A